MKILNTLLTEKPAIGIAGGVTGTMMPFIEALTKFAQCGAAVCGFLLAGWTLYLKFKNKDAKGRKSR
jgi:hypothetical protein